MHLKIGDRKGGPPDWGVRAGMVGLAFGRSRVLPSHEGRNAALGGGVRNR